MQMHTITLKNSDVPLSIHTIHTKKALITLRALSHPLRQQLLQLIDEEGQSTVTTIFVKLKMEQSVVSQHLAILRKAGFVVTNRKGKFIHYKVNYERVQKIVELVEKMNT